MGDTKRTQKTGENAWETEKKYTEKHQTEYTLRRKRMNVWFMQFLKFIKLKMRYLIAQGVS